MELFEEARRREREGWGEYLGACWRDIWVGLKRGGGELWRRAGEWWDVGVICVAGWGYCAVAAVKWVRDLVRGVGGWWGRRGEQ